MRQVFVLNAGSSSLQVPAGRRRLRARARRGVVNDASDHAGEAGAVLVVPTDEEVEMATQAAALVSA